MRIVRVDLLEQERMRKDDISIEEDDATLWNHLFSHPLACGIAREREKR